jgi:3-oxoacyl-[acyl-carrier-protein] synthase III
VFAPGFGAGAVAGFAVLRVDPAIVAPERNERQGVVLTGAAPISASSTDDVRAAFGD